MVIDLFKSQSAHLKKWFETPVSIAPLLVFRIIFGFYTAISSVRFLAKNWVETHFILPTFHFKYFGFSFIEPLPGYWMYVINGLMVIASIGILLGYRYKLNAFIFALLFTYTELIDITYYLNHYYYVTIMAWFMVILPAHHSFSLDVYLGRKRDSHTAPRWTIWIIKFQLCIVYFFAGIAKINHAWLLDAMPLRLWLPSKDMIPVIGSFLKYKLTAYLFSWFGMIYDTLIPFFLWNRRTRFFAYFIVIIFHISTGLLFPIGVFPLVMILSTFIFFSEEKHEKIIVFLKSLIAKIVKQKNVKFRKIKLKTSSKKLGTFQYALLTMFIVFQILFPMRYLFYDGNLFWNEEGYRFSWRVMLVEKAGDATFYVTDRTTRKKGEVITSDFLNPHQIKQMSFQPDLILQFAHHLHDYYESNGMNDPIITVEAYVTMNGEIGRLMIDPKVDLSKVRDSWRQKNWVTDL